MNAFDIPTWAYVLLSLIVLTALCSFEDVLFHQKKIDVALIARNFLVMFQTLLQEASKNR